MLAAPASWRQTMKRIASRALVERVEHREVALARHAEREVHAVADQRIDKQLAAASGRHRPSAHSCRTAKPLAFSISSRPRGPAR